MLRNKPTAAQLDRKYHNVAEEGRGTYAYYRQTSKKVFRRLIYAIFIFILIICLMVFMFSIIDKHGYGQQWKIFIHYIFHFKPGSINNTKTLVMMYW